MRSEAEHSQPPGTWISAEELRLFDPGLPIAGGAVRHFVCPRGHRGMELASRLEMSLAHVGRVNARGLHQTGIDRRDLATYHCAICGAASRETLAEADA